MKRFLITGAPLAAACLLAAGCGTPGSYQQSHSTAGAIMGVGAGTIIGAAYGRPAEGALAGALIGGAAGAVAGENLDSKAAADAQAQAYYEAQARAQAQAAANPPVGKADLIEMSKAKISDEVIINKVQSASFVQPLSAQDIIELKNEGVSDKVVNAMISKAQSQSASAPPATGAAVKAPAQSTVTTYYYVDPVYPWIFYFDWAPSRYYAPDIGPGPRPHPGPGPRPGPRPGPGPGPHPGPRPPR